MNIILPRPAGVYLHGPLSSNVRPQVRSTCWRQRLPERHYSKTEYMLRSVFTIGCVAAVLAASAASPPGKVYRGTYFHNFETSAFTPEGSSEPWCVSVAEMSRAQVAGSKSGRAKVIVRGELSARGKYCNLGAYPHMLRVIEIVEVTEITSE